MNLELYQLLGFGSGLLVVGLVAGFALATKFIREDYEYQLKEHRDANQACYDEGFKDGERSKIKSISKVLISDSYVLNNGGIVSPEENFYRPKIGPKR